MIPLNLRFRYSILFLGGIVSRFFLKKPVVRSIASGLGIESLLIGLALQLPSPPLATGGEGSEGLFHLGYLKVKGTIFCTPSAVKVAAPFLTSTGTVIFGISVHHFSRRSQGVVFFAFTCS